MDARTGPAEISSQISIPQPKEAVKAAGASPLQFASHIQIASNTQSSRIRFPDAKSDRTLDGPYRLSAVVSIDRTHPSEATSLCLSLSGTPQTRHPCIPISAYMSNRMKHFIISKTPFFPNPASICTTVASNPAPQMEIHGGSAPPAVTNSDRTSEIH
ncbi:hypothetical protein CDAR_553721 [Caerostris darwini]|uniref:Uncharacterized protein n=1 Tax=Caerostris darwini TaxID=1538125 RepID=A0AAV4WL62_9ARAC|nr:hypothetical protein CDAR_553721 [Caerostris darwini]